MYNLPRSSSETAECVSIPFCFPLILKKKTIKSDFMHRFDWNLTYAKDLPSSGLDVISGLICHALSKSVHITNWNSWKYNLN